MISAPLPNETLTHDHFIEFISIICAVEAQLGRAVNADEVVNNSILSNTQMTGEVFLQRYGHRMRKAAIGNIFLLLADMGWAQPGDRGSYTLDANTQVWYERYKHDPAAAVDQLSEAVGRLWFAQLDRSEYTVFEEQVLAHFENPDDLTRNKIPAAYNLLESFGLTAKPNEDFSAEEAITDDETISSTLPDEIEGSKSLWLSDMPEVETIEEQTNTPPAPDEPAQQPISVQQEPPEPQALEKATLHNPAEMTTNEPTGPESQPGTFGARLFKRGGMTQQAVDESATRHSKRSSLSPFKPDATPAAGPPDIVDNRDEFDQKNNQALVDSTTETPPQSVPDKPAAPLKAPPVQNPRGFGSSRRGAFDEPSDPAQPQNASHLNRMQRAQEQQKNQPTEQDVSPTDTPPASGGSRQYVPGQNLPRQAPEKPSLDAYRRAPIGSTNSVQPPGRRGHDDNRTYGPRAKVVPPPGGPTSPQSGADPVIILTLADGERVEITQEFFDQWRAEHKLSFEETLAALRDIFLAQKDEPGE